MEEEFVCTHDKIHWLVAKIELPHKQAESVVDELIVPSGVRTRSVRSLGTQDWTPLSTGIYLLEEERMRNKFPAEFDKCK